MRLNTEKFLKDIISDLKNSKIVLCEENELNKIKNNIREYCNQFNDGIINLSELVKEIGSADIKRDIQYSKPAIERLGNSIFDLNNKILKYIDCNGIKK